MYTAMAVAAIAACGDNGREPEWIASSVEGTALDLALIGSDIHALVRFDDQLVVLQLDEDGAQTGTAVLADIAAGASAELLAHPSGDLIAGWRADQPGVARFERITTDGTIVWSRSIEIAAPEVLDLAVLDDGGIAVIGWTITEVRAAIVLVLEADGSERWRRTIEDGDLNYGYAVAATADGNLIAVTSDLESTTLTKLAPDGTQLWTARDEANNFRQDLAVSSTGALYLSGTRGDAPEELEVWAARFDATGEPEWARTHGSGSGLAVTTDRTDGLIIVGTDDAYAVRYSAAGHISWVAYAPRPDTIPVAVEADDRGHLVILATVAENGIALTRYSLH